MSKLRNLIYMAAFRFAAGIVLDEKLDFVLNDILHVQCMGKNVNSSLIKHVQIEWFGEC